MKPLISSIALASSVALVAAATAQAEFVSFTYSGANAGLSASGSLEVTAGVVTDGSITVTGSGAMDGTYSLYGGPGGYSPGSYFIYDNLIDCVGPQCLTTAGLLFVNEAGDEVNVWGNSPLSYSLYGWVAGSGGSYSPADDGGTFSLVIPGPGALALVGVAGLVGARRRRA